MAGPKNVGDNQQNRKTADAGFNTPPVVDPKAGESIKKLENIRNTAFANSLTSSYMKTNPLQKPLATAVLAAVKARDERMAAKKQASQDDPSLDFRTAEDVSNISHKNPAWIAKPVPVPPPLAPNLPAKQYVSTTLSPKLTQAPHRNPVGTTKPISVSPPIPNLVIKHRPLTPALEPKTKAPQLPSSTQKARVAVKPASHTIVGVGPQSSHSGLNSSRPHSASKTPETTSVSVAAMKAQFENKPSTQDKLATQKDNKSTTSPVVDKWVKRATGPEVAAKLKSSFLKTPIANHRGPYSGAPATQWKKETSADQGKTSWKPAEQPTSHAARETARRSSRDSSIGRN